MKRHNRRPQVNQILGSEFVLNLPLKKKVSEGEGCECDITGIFWENTETAGVFDQTNIDHDLGNAG